MLSIFRNPKYFLLLFLTIIIGSQIITNTIGQTTGKISKILIFVALVFLLVLNRNKLSKKIYKYLILAIIFSIINASISTFSQGSDTFLLYVIITNLIAHLFYCLAFFSQWSNPKGINFWLMPAIIFIYSVFIYTKIAPNLGDYNAPIIVYILVILLMSISALGRKNKKSHLSHTLIIIGTALIIIADAIYGINKFFLTIPYSAFLNTISFSLGHYLIIHGFLIENENNN